MVKHVMPFEFEPSQKIFNFDIGSSEFMKFKIKELIEEQERKSRPMPRKKLVSEILKDSRSWTKGNVKLHTSWGWQYCIMGALMEKYGIFDMGYQSLEFHRDAELIAEAIVTKHKGYRNFHSNAQDNIIKFNDDRIRTHQEVLDVLIAAGV